MNNEEKSINVALMQTEKKLNNLYHRYGVFCGMSDPTMWVLYTLFTRKDTKVTQNDLVNEWCYPKQTLNYAVGGLVKSGMVTLEKCSGRGNIKAIILTDEGNRFCEEKITPLIRAEDNSINRLSDSEKRLLLELNEKQCGYFEEELEKEMGEIEKK